MTWHQRWPTTEMEAARRRLENLRALVQKSPAPPKNAPQDLLRHLEDSDAELARFLVVRSTGFVERTFELCIQHFAESHSHPFVASHVHSGLFKGRNAKAGTLIERLHDLNPAWADDLNDFFDYDDGRARRELNFMVTRRNLIAHGGSESVGRVKALEIANLSLEIGDLLCTLVDPR